MIGRFQPIYRDSEMQSSLAVTPNTTTTTYTPNPGYKAIEEIIVQAVTAAIDNNILPNNIKYGVSILGINGVYTGFGTLVVTSFTTPRLKLAAANATQNGNTITIGE